jgi:hypothetical protein
MEIRFDIEEEEEEEEMEDRKTGSSILMGILCKEEGDEGDEGEAWPNTWSFHTVTFSSEEAGFLGWTE